MSSGIGEAPQLAKGRILSTSGRAKTILSLKEVKDAVALVVGNTQFSSPGYGQQVTSVLLLHRQLQFCGICREQFVSLVQCVRTARATRSAWCACIIVPTSVDPYQRWTQANTWIPLLPSAIWTDSIHPVQQFATRLPGLHLDPQSTHSYDHRLSEGYESQA